MASTAQAGCLMNIEADEAVANTAWLPGVQADAHSDLTIRWPVLAREAPLNLDGSAYCVRGVGKDNEEAITSRRDLLAVVTANCVTYQPLMAIESDAVAVIPQHAYQ